jgi:uncharacterized iron-regulated protein
VKILGRAFLVLGAGLSALGLLAAVDLTARAEAPHPLCATEPCAVIETVGPDGRARVLDPATPWPTGPIVGAELLLLGEVHDNPAHHRLRSQLILALAAAKGGPQTTRTGLVFEHIRTDQHLALVAFRAADRQRPRGVRDLMDALSWAASGWPAAAMFEPLFAAALDLEWPIIPGNLPRNEIRNVARSGLGAVPSDDVARLGLDQPLPSPLQTALLDELEASHCGLMPRSAFAGMADAQRYRDAVMARALVDAADAHGRAILLAGNGHVRSDRGVPWHLARMAPERRRVVVSYVEVAAGRNDPATYMERGPDSGPTADYVVLTARADRADPCTEVRRTLRAPAR